MQRAGGDCSSWIFGIEFSYSMVFASIEGTYIHHTVMIKIHEEADLFEVHRAKTYCQ